MEISNITGIVTFAHAVPYHLAEFMGTKEQVASNRKKIYGISVFMFVVVTVFLQILLNLSLKYSALFLVAAFVIVKFMENVIYDSFFKFGFACSETHTPQMITFWYCVQAVNIVCDVLPYIRPRHWLHPVAGVTLSTVLTLRYISGFVIVSMFCWIMWRYYHNPKLVGEQNWGRVAIFLTYQAITTYSWQVNLSSRLVMAVVIVIYYIKVFHMIIRDTYMEYVHNVDYSKCLGNAQGCQSVYTAMMAGAVIVMRTVAPAGESGTTEMANVIILLFGFGISFAALSFGADRYMDGESYAAVIFGAQLMISFILEIIFLSSSLTTIDFWLVLMITSIYHSVRNMGYMEDLLEWFKIRYRTSWLYRTFEACYTCIDYRMWKSTEKKHEADSKKRGSSFNDLRIMFLIKTQGEIVQMITPFILILALLVDMMFVNFFGGQGTFTIGLSSISRSYALLVYVVTFGTKVFFYLVSRAVLKTKRKRFIEQLAELKSIDCTNMEAAQKQDHRSRMKFVAMRLQITKVYLMSLLLNVNSSKYQATDRYSSMVFSEQAVEMIQRADKETDVGLVGDFDENGSKNEIIESPLPAKAQEADVENVVDEGNIDKTESFNDNDVDLLFSEDDAPKDEEYSRLFSPKNSEQDDEIHAEEYSAVYLRYLQKYFLFFWASCSMFFFFSFYLTASYRIQLGYADEEE